MIQEGRLRVPEVAVSGAGSKLQPAYRMYSEVGPSQVALKLIEKDSVQELGPYFRTTVLR